MLKQSNMARSVWVVLDTNHGLLAANKSMGVHKSYTTLVSSTTASDGDVAGVVSTCGLLLSHSQLSDRSTLVKVVMHWFFVVSGTWLQVAVGVRLDLDLSHR